MKRRLLVCTLLAFCVFCGQTFANAEIKDSESASHGAEASSHRIVETFSFPGFKVLQFELPVLSIYSYMLISDGQALLVDPVRDISFYLDVAKKENAEIKGVYLSHSHADFVAGHMELVSKLKCPIHQGHKSGVGYEINSLDENSVVQIGQAVLKFLDTPGHTPDGMTAVVYSKDDLNTPRLVFTGDALFVGSMGRPDLLEGKTPAAWLANAMFDSWNNKLSKLPDSVLVFPAHGAGSLCGANLSEESHSTIGKEKASNPYAKKTKRGEFVAALLGGLPETPQYFGHNAKMNREGPKPVDWASLGTKELKPSAELTDPQKYYVLDLRDAASYSEGHVPGSINIAVRGRFENWVGTIVPWGSKVILVGSPEELKEGILRLQRIGYSADVLPIDAWKNAKLPVNTNPPINPQELYKLMEAGESPLIVDVRLPNEWMALRIGTVLNLPLNRLADLSAKLDPEKPVILVCNSAYRSSLAVGIVERKGFKQARSLEGGSQAWIDAGLPVFEASKTGSTAETPKVQVKLPERMSAEDLRRLVLDLPGTFTLVDIRPADQYKTFNVPGSENVSPAQLVNDAAYLVGAGPLIIVDRDGTLGMSIGGILSQKTERNIKVLFGGMESYVAAKPVSSVGNAETKTAESFSASPQQSAGQPGAAQKSAPKTEKPKRPNVGC
jgi:rhodanese-related sulfurtransferase